MIHLCLDPSEWLLLFDPSLPTFQMFKNGYSLRIFKPNGVHPKASLKLLVPAAWRYIKYLGSMFNANGGAEKDVNNRVKIAWSKWRELLG